MRRTFVKMSIDIDTTIILNLENTTQFRGTFRLLMTPLAGHDSVYNANIHDARIDGEVSNSRSIEWGRKTAVKFPDIDAALIYVNRAASMSQEFHGLVICKNNYGEEIFVLGDWIGFGIDEWFQNCGPLWEVDTLNNQRATEIFTRVSQNLAKILFKRHDEDEFVGDVMTDVYIHPLTSTITTVSITDTCKYVFYCFNFI